VKPTIDRLAYADCAHVEAELRAQARGEAFPPPLAHPAGAPCPTCSCCSGAANAVSQAPALSRNELDALHFRFWSADHQRFDHVGFAAAVLAACGSGIGPAVRAN
jgi:hypothetical protein